MGIDGGFFNELRSVSTQVDLRKLSGLIGVGGRVVLAWDVSGILHRRGRAVDPVGCMVRMEYDRLIASIMRLLRLLKKYGLEIVCVFDGASQPAKARTDTKRSDGRRAAQARLDALVAQGASDAALRKAAADAFKRTPALEAALKAALVSGGFPFQVAPEEADSQLAWLARTGAVCGVISEDADMLALGVPIMLRNLDVDGAPVSTCEHM
jgi:exonuclease-1